VGENPSALCIANISPTIAKEDLPMLKEEGANHSAYVMKLDLQQFADEDDAILPDDYVPEEIETTSEEVTDESASDTTLTEEQETLEQQSQEQTTSTETPKFKVKFNHEEKELGYDEAVPLIQKGMNYDKLQERLSSLETDPRLAFVEQQAQKHNLSVPEYLQAVKAEEEKAHLNDLLQKNIPEDVAKEILEGRKDREDRKQKEADLAEKEKNDIELSDFLAYFKEANDRAFDPDKDTIPNEVWEANKNGKPLQFAYMEHYTKQLKSQLKVAKQNEENVKIATIGSVTSHGSTETAVVDDFTKGFDSVE
jgi:hypothetical protein